MWLGSGVRRWGKHTKHTLITTTTKTECHSSPTFGYYAQLWLTGQRAEESGPK